MNNTIEGTSCIVWNFALFPALQTKNCHTGH